MERDHGLFTQDQELSAWSGKYQEIKLEKEGIVFELLLDGLEIEVTVSRAGTTAKDWDAEAFSKASVADVVAGARLFQKILEELSWLFGSHLQVVCYASGKRHKVWSKVAARFPQLTVVADS